MRYFLSGFVPRGSVVLAITTFGSYVLGMLRDRTFAHTFGASVDLDAYNAAFLVPDFAFNVLVASGIAAAVVPLFTQLSQKNMKAAYAYMNSITSMATIVMIVVGLLLFIGAPWLSVLVAPGLEKEGQQLVAQLMRVLAFSPILFAASNALGAMLIAQKRFLLYGISPMLYNLGIIGGAIFLAPTMGVLGIAYGTLIGAVFHVAIRMVDAWRSGWRLQPLMQFPIPHFKATVQLMIPKMIGHPVELVTFWVFTSLASLLSTGSITTLNFARNFQSVPVSILGIAMATAAFPALTQAALTSPGQLRNLFHRTAGAILAASTAAALLMFIIRKPLVNILLGGGAFDAAAVEHTALVLGVFCLAIPTESLSHLFARAFYATKNTVIPVSFSVVSLLVAGGSAYALLQPFGIIGLPIGFFLGSLVKTIGLFIVFRSRN